MLQYESEEAAVKAVTALKKNYVSPYAFAVAGWADPDYIEKTVAVIEPDATPSESLPTKTRRLLNLN